MAEEEYDAAAAAGASGTSRLMNLAARPASPSEDEVETTTTKNVTTTITVPLTPEEYFSTIDLNGRDVGRMPKTTAKVSYG